MSFAENAVVGPCFRRASALDKLSEKGYDKTMVNTNGLILIQNNHYNAK